MLDICRRCGSPDNTIDLKSGYSALANNAGHEQVAKLVYIQVALEHILHHIININEKEFSNLLYYDRPITAKKKLQYYNRSLVNSSEPKICLYSYNRCLYPSNSNS